MRKGNGSMAIKTADFEKTFVALQYLVKPFMLSHKMRLVADYDSGKRHIMTRYLEPKEGIELKSLPDDMQFCPTKVNCGVDWEYGTVKGSGGQNREFSEANLQSVFELLGLHGMCGTKGKIRVIVDYDPDEAEISVKHIIPVE